VSPNPQFKSSATPSAWISALLIALLVASANYLLWANFNRPESLPNVDGRIHGLAYSPFARDQSPLEGSRPEPAQIERDLKLMSGYTRRIRTYAATDGLEVIVPMASSHQLQVAAGAWIDRRFDNNERELAAVIQQARTQAAIARVVVGNEVILRGDLSVTQLINYLDRARHALDTPVTTADSWATWMAYPELVEHVDYLMVHILPYWEGDTVGQALKRVDRQMSELQLRYPGKPIVIGEIGWPSHGSRFEDAVASLDNEARFLRQFLRLADSRGWDYYLMEAFDQPWKREIEGRVGAYWGLFSADRELKFDLVGPMESDEHWRLKALACALLALLPMLWFGLSFKRMGAPAVTFFATLMQLAVSLIVWLVTLPLQFYLEWYDWLALLLLLPAQLAILGILLSNGFEFAEMVLGKPLQRHFTLLKPDPSYAPKVSLHLACCNEPPEMVIATLESLHALDYPNFEVLVIDNNTLDPALWQPVRERCSELGAQFRFYTLGPWPGFKAGALNFALSMSDPQAEIIAVIDSDYVVEAHWLSQTVGYFKDRNVGFVQLPQAHREFQASAFRRVCNFEYEGFFKIGMHHRHERDAIIMHGTMTLIRRAPLESSGGWAEWCICEDAELGLRLYREGFSSVYIDQKLGRGLTPADIAAFKSQRFRWAFGAMQIMRKRLAWMTTEKRLSPGQRFHFLTGWFSWFADALHGGFSILAILWTVGMIMFPRVFAMPLPLYLIPVLGLFVFKASFGLLSYQRRVQCTLPESLGAALASMALSHMIARGIIQGLTSEKPQFNRTAKKRRINARPSTWGAVREELYMLAGLIAAIVGVCVAIGWQHSEAQLWIMVLAAQAIPYASALALAAIAKRSERA